jgi:hypothetical protein
MRRFNFAWLAMILIGVQALDIATPTLWAQSSRTAPPPVRNAGRTRLFGRNKQEEKQAEKPPAKAPVVIPGIPGAQLAGNIPGADLGDDPLLTKVKKAINVNARRFLSPNDGHTPWMILHGVLALRQDFRIRVDGKIVNGLDYVTQRNPVYRGVLPAKPNDSASPMVNVQGYWFESTAYGGRAQPYQVPFAFEGHINQSLAILSSCDLPLNHPIVVNDSQRPGMPKTITMDDMVKSAQKTVTLGNPYELAWTLWFFSNYLDPQAQWTDMHGGAWSMEQLVRYQVNAPLVVSDPMKGPPCGGTHALFALAGACNSYQQKHGKLDGTWIAARRTLDYYTQAAKAGQNADWSMSAGYFHTYRKVAENYGDRLKASGHMLEWLMMALPPEKLQEEWVTKAINRLADDLLQGQNQPLSHEDTGSLYHSVHALVLYRNRVDPPESTPPAAQTVEVPPEQRNPAPGPMPNPDKTATPAPAPDAPKPAPEMQKAAPNLPGTTATDTEATIRLIGPGPKRLMFQEAKPLLKPITNTRETEPLKPGDTPAAPPKTETPNTDGPERMPLLVPLPPELEKPVPAPKPGPAPGEPKSEGAIVKPLTKEEGGTEPAPLFGDGKPAAEASKTPPAPPMPMPMADQAKPPAGGTPPTPPAAEAEKPSAEPIVPPSLPEPTPRPPSSTGD